MSDRYARLRELEAKATEPPWRDDGYSVLTARQSGRHEACASDPQWGDNVGAHNTAFIAEARNQVRALLEERDALAKAAASLAVPVEAMIASGSIAAHDQETQKALRDGLREVRAALTRAEEQEKADNGR